MKYLWCGVIYYIPFEFRSFTDIVLNMIKFFIKQPLPWLKDSVKRRKMRFFWKKLGDLVSSSLLYGALVWHFSHMNLQTHATFFVCPTPEDIMT